MMRFPVNGGTPMFDGLDASHLPPQTAFGSFDISPDGQRMVIRGRSPFTYELWSLDGVLSFLYSK
jgi:hypothetical protein